MVGRLGNGAVVATCLLVAAAACGSAGGRGGLALAEAARGRAAAEARVAPGAASGPGASVVPGTTGDAPAATGQLAFDPVTVTECRSGCIAVTLDVADGPPSFRPYLESVARRIGLNLVFPLETVRQDAGGEVVVLFRIDRKGNVVSKEVRESSKRELLDRSAMRSLEEAGRFNPFPPAPYVSSIAVRARFRYTM